LNPRWKVIGILTVIIIIISILTFTPSAKAEDDLVLSGSETFTITGFTICQNVTISDEATLIVENAYLRINGLLRMSDYARLFIIRSTLVVNPPALNDSTRVVHIVDYAILRIENSSNVIFHPQPTPTNISYMLIEDNACFLLKDSTFFGDLPAIINQSIEVASVTAGVYLLSGEASWHIINSDVTGRLSTEGQALTGRWFWCSLHQRSSLNIENSELELLSFSDPTTDSTLLKPVAGTTTIKNSKILVGAIDIEIVAKANFENSSFYSIVEFMDQSKVMVLQCNFYNDVKVGTTLGLVETQHNPETVVEIDNSTFDEKITCKANSTTVIRGTTLMNLTINDNASVDVSDSHIEHAATLNNFAQAAAHNSFINIISMHDTALVIFEGDFEISVLYVYATGTGNKDQKSSFSNAKINKIQLQSDKSDPENIKNVTVFLKFKDMDIGNLTFYNDVDATFECTNTSIYNYLAWRSGENVTFTFINITSELSDLTALNENIVIKIYHRLEVIVKLNEIGIETEVVVSDVANQELKGGTVSGAISFDLLYKTVEDGEVTVNEDYMASTSYLGFSETKDVILNSSKTVIFNWVDNSSPIISQISYGPKEWNIGKDITISAIAQDMDIQSIKSVTLFYRIDDGEWTEMGMFKIADDTYEAIIPKQSEQCTISFYIVSEDVAGNVVNSEHQSLNVGEKESLISLVSIIIFIILVLALIVRKGFQSGKIKKYAIKFEFKRSK
jgi:hypothetical protein